MEPNEKKSINIEPLYMTAACIIAAAFLIYTEKGGAAWTYFLIFAGVIWLTKKD